MRDDRWNFCTAVGYEDEDGDELFDLTNDPEEEINVAQAYPEIVAANRTEVETVIGQPLPGRMIEVCDSAPGPMTVWLSKKLK